LIPRSNEEKQELETNIRNDGEESNTFTNMSNNIVNNVVNKETNSENLVNENRQPEDHQSQSIEEHITKDKKKVRCKKWPGCKNESCEYAHPKETVTIYKINNYSAHFSQNVCSEKNVFSFIQI